MSDDQLPEWVKPGAKYRYDFGPDNRNTGRTFHVRGIVDGRAVIREWSKSRKRWIYTVEGGVEFQVMADHIKPERRSKT
jgi:hypothetical protein